MPWKNGGGVTTEIAVSPEGAGLDGFDWRISTALVPSDGPFSAFPGMDRTLAVIHGDGLVLEVEGFEPVTLCPGDRPHSFAADIPTSARLLGGSVTDLNVMTKRGRFGHVVSALDPSARRVPASCAAFRFLLCAYGGVSIETGHRIDLGPLDIAEIGSNEIGLAGAAGHAALFIIEIMAVA